MLLDFPGGGEKRAFQAEAQRQGDVQEDSKANERPAKRPRHASASGVHSNLKKGEGKRGGGDEKEEKREKKSSESASFKAAEVSGRRNAADPPSAPTDPN